MSWAKFAIEKLQQGESIQIRPRGHSVVGKGAQCAAGYDRAM